MKEESYYLRQAIRLIEDKLGWGDNADWPNAYFEALSKKIELETGVLISEITFRRLFGKSKTYLNYNPHLTTKNAIARFLGYENWTAFVRQQDLLAEYPSDRLVSETEIPPPLVLPRHIRKNYVLRLAWLIGLLVIAAGAALYKKKQNDTSAIVFEGKNLEGDVPLHTVLRYDVSATAFRDFRMTGHGSLTLSKRKHYIIQDFRAPNFYTLRLMGDDTPIGTVNVLVRSKGWEGAYVRNEQLHPFPADSFYRHSQLYLAPRVITQHQLLAEDYFTRFTNIRDFGVSGDNYTLEARVKNPAKTGGLPCYDVKVEIIRELPQTQDQSREEVCFTAPDYCARYAYAHYGDQEENAYYHPLDGLNQDFSDWRRIKLVVKGQKLAVYYEGKVVYGFRYSPPGGNIKGITFSFRGSGAIDYVKLYNGAHRLVYSDDFDTNPANFP